MNRTRVQPVQIVFMVDHLSAANRSQARVSVYGRLPGDEDVAVRIGVIAPAFVVVNAVVLIIPSEPFKKAAAVELVPIRIINERQ